MGPLPYTHDKLQADHAFAYSRRDAHLAHQVGAGYGLVSERYQARPEVLVAGAAYGYRWLEISVLELPTAKEGIDEEAGFGADALVCLPGVVGDELLEPACTYGFGRCCLVGAC